jgi:hypothetical protein
MTRTNADTEFTINDPTEGLVKEEVPSLQEFAEEPGGAWPKGWYAAEIIEGFSSRSGKQFLTEDAPSQKGDSRNATFCFLVTGKAGEERTMFTRINYRETDFDPARLEYVKEVRDRNKGVKGRWDDADAQRTSLALRSVAGIEKALGFSIRDRHGNVIPQRAVGQKLRVRLTTTEEGFNEINAFDALKK